VKKISTVATNRNEIFEEHKLTIGLDLGDRSGHYCILDEAGEVILEHNFSTTPKGIHQVFNRIPRSRIALETGTHSPAGKPAADPDGPRGDRGPCAQRAAHWGE
jgi:predicted NBD/HSP70 family sugar kinase